MFLFRFLTTELEARGIYLLVNVWINAIFKQCIRFGSNAFYWFPCYVFALYLSQRRFNLELSAATIWLS